MTRPVKTAEGDVYEVFAKNKKEDTLHHVGSVIAITPDLARMYADRVYDEWSWREMIIVPRREIITLVAPE